MKAARTRSAAFSMLESEEILGYPISERWMPHFFGAYSAEEYGIYRAL